MTKPIERTGGSLGSPSLTRAIRGAAGSASQARTDHDLAGQVFETSIAADGALGGGGSGGMEDDYPETPYFQKLRKNSAGTDFQQLRLNLIEGANITITVAADAGNDEVDVTIAGAAAYTDEQAQDAVGAMLADTDQIDLSYVDATPSLSARFANGLVLSRTTVANANYSALASDAIIEYTSLSVTRTVTFPLANSVPAGKLLIIKDSSGNASATVVIKVAPSGSDTLDGVALVENAVTAPHGQSVWYSNGSNGWLRLTRGNLRYSGPSDVTFAFDLANDSGNALALTINTQRRSIDLWADDAGLDTGVTGAVEIDNIARTSRFGNSGTAIGCDWSFKMPDNYNGSTLLVSAIGVSNRSSGVGPPGPAYFEVSAGSFANGDAVPATLGTAQNSTQTMVSPAPGTRHYQQWNFAALTPGGSPAAGCGMRLRFVRDSGNAADTYPGDFELVMLRVEFEVSSLTE